MNHRSLSLSAFCFLLAGSVSLPVALRADDMSGTPAATNAPAPAAQPPLAQPAIVSPSPTASGDTTPAAPTPAATTNPETYTVVSGDTLWGISHKFNTSIKKLKKLNGLTKSNLKPGQVLKIPPATTTAQ
jgi:LysM repeat protein